MKRKILLAIFTAALFSSANAQKKTERVTAFAITGSEKGNTRWTEVNLIDVSTGEVIQSVYQSKSEVKKLNARTGKPIAISDVEATTQTYVIHEGQKTTTINGKGETIIVTTGRMPNAAPYAAGSSEKETRRVTVYRQNMKKEEPFATSSAALAYDKKHERLYYTPMGINQLRYIDMKAKSPSVMYFENESFGTVAGMGDVNNQITRMVIAGDGNGYALTNNAEQLIRFTTKKKPEITTLGAVTDDPSNGKFSVNSRNAYGGDMVADNQGNLYLITANRRVYRINIETRVAKYLGSIKGLPENYTTNGAVVENDNKILVTSSTSTKGYYRFDLESLQAEMVSAGEKVFNASDLANANLIKAKKKNDEKQTELAATEAPIKEEALQNAVEKSIRTDLAKTPGLSVYPNPVTNYQTRLSMSEYPEGRYEVQMVDLTGRQINRQVVQVNSKSQLVEFRMPTQIAKGAYFIRIVNSENIIMNSEKIIVK